LTVTAVSVPGHGTASINPDNTVTYTPANGFFGLDTFTYTVRNSPGATATRNVSVNVNALCAIINTGSFLDDFESGAPGWTVDTPKNNTGASSPTWSVVPDAMAHSPANSFHSDSTTLDLKDDRLTSPRQKLSSTSHLKFWHRYFFEDGFDGGAVEVSTDGGATWVDVLAGGGHFVSGGYNGHISPSYGSAIAGRPAWTGGSQTAATDPMTQVDIDMGAFAGVNVRVRFHLACDALLAGSTPGLAWWIDDVQFTNTPQEGPCPTVVSRKTHGSADFDVALPLSGTPGIESRGTGSTGNAYTLVYTLGGNLSAAGTATVTQGTATVGTPTLGPNANQVTVPLTAVATAQHLVITLNGVQDGTGAILNHLVARMDVLVGDVNLSRVVNTGDTNLCKAQALQPVTNANFRNDVNASGVINTGDVNIIKQNALAQLPP
jgi:Bacterial Ig domain